MATPAPATPIWFDLSTADLAAATRFYADLFGWTAEKSGDGYTNFRKDGKLVAGAGQLHEPDHRTAWTLYLATDEAAAVADRVEAAGGTTLMPPMEIAGYGRLAIFADPAGAVFGVWQGGTHHGAELLDRPGAVVWCELAIRDADQAKSFYRTVFGWQPDDRPSGPVAYTIFTSRGTEVAGMMPMVGDDWPADLPPHWMVYFGVDDCGAAAARAAQLGGEVVVPPTDIPPGMFAVLSDPQGGVFSVISSAPEAAGARAE
jgi:uncharacterized protein